MAGHLNPTPKIGSAGVVGAVTLLVVFVLSRLGVDLPADAATTVGVLLTVATGYLVPDHTSPPPAPEPAPGQHPVEPQGL